MDVEPQPIEAMRQTVCWVSSRTLSSA